MQIVIHCQSCPVFGHTLSTHVQFGIPIPYKRSLLEDVQKFACKVCCKNRHMDYSIKRGGVTHNCDRSQSVVNGQNIDTII